jgi:hypothetical protein
MSRPRQGVFGKPGKLFARSEFLPGWKKCSGTAETMIKARYIRGRKKYFGSLQLKGNWQLYIAFNRVIPASTRFKFPGSYGRNGRIIQQRIPA